MAAEGLSEIVPIPSRKCRPEPLLGLRWRRFSVLLFFCILIALLALTGLCLIQGLASLNSLPAHGLIPGSEMSKPVQVHIKTSLAASGDPENVQINYATFGSKSLHDLPERLTEVIKQQLHSDTNEATKENSGDAVASTTAVGTPTKATLKLKLKKTRQGFARVMVIASGERQYCASATGQQIQLFNLKTKQLYSTMQHYVFQNSTLHPNPQLKLGWNKIGVLQELLHRYTADEVSWFLWLEESAMFVDIHSPLPFEQFAGKDVVLLGCNERKLEEYRCSALSGNLLVRNSDWSRAFLQSLARDYGKVWNTVFKKGHPAGMYQIMRHELHEFVEEAQERAAILHMMKLNPEYKKQVHCDNESLLTVCRDCNMATAPHALLMHWPHCNFCQLGNEDSPCVRSWMNSVMWILGQNNSTAASRGNQ